MRRAHRRKYISKYILVAAVLSAFAPFVVLAIDASLAANGSVAYTYDALGRVTTASYDTGVCVIYNYDANGNRLSETVLVSSGGSTGYWGCFNWNARNWGAS